MNSSTSANEPWRPASSHLEFQQQQQSQHNTVRKKTSFASKIRRVFNKPNGIASTKGHELVAGNMNISQQHQVLEDVISMTSRDEGSRSFHPGSLMEQHRGSVSSSSSAETMSVGQGEVGVITPLTSPEMSPLGSPRLKYASLPSGPEAAAVPEVMNLQLPASSVIMSEPDSRRPSAVNASLPAFVNTPVATAADSVPTTNSAEKRQSLEPTPTRTVKKRLSFASITSFFQPRGSEAATAQAMKKKQQRSSSVPNVEHPLMIVGRQIAGFQRRHSLNDMESSGKGYAKQQESPYKNIAPSWDKDCVSTNAAETTAAVLSVSVNKPSDHKASSSTKSKIHSVFGKQIRKKNKNNKGEVASESLSEEPAAVVLRTKPLRSALVRRPQRTPSIKRGPSYRTSIYEQSPPSQFRYDSQASIPGRRFSQCESMANHSPDVGANSRQSSLEEQKQQQQTSRVGERIVGPTRHRRQSSISSRQASQLGYHPANDRRRSYRYSTSEEFDAMQYSDIMTPEHYSQQPQIQSPQIHQQRQQSLFQGVYNHQHPNDYEMFSRQSAQGIHPMAAVPPFSQEVEAMFMPHHDQISSVAAEEGSVTPIPGVAESYPIPSPSPQKNSPPTSPANGSNITIAPTVTSRNPAVANHPHRSSSYQQGDSGSSGTGYNSHRNSFVVPPAGRPSVDQALIIETQSACHQHNFQQQQQIQIQQQMHAQQQRQQQQQQQTFTASSVPHTLLQDPFAPYSHPFQFNKQQCTSPQRPFSYHQQYPEHYMNRFNQFGMTAPPGSPPSPELLRPVRQLHFSPEPKIHITWTADQYDRSSDPNITAHRLTPAVAQKIKLELNQFKSQEMIVHQESRANTHFFV
ncbi:bud neck involved protein [Mortierella polycephala]|uniref:Bud neck involved protein n=1 Tax=Mortierella polycephala TaxID=41804 RepID=A0A9P6UA56_9FUNG|nr:bud neck involved protein [Mortierella polycephala]